MEATTMQNKRKQADHILIPEIEAGIHWIIY